MKSIGQSIDRFLREYGLQDYLKFTEIEEEWEDIIGKGISKHTKLKDFGNGILEIEVDDPIWIQELSFKTGEILKRINSCFKKKLVKRIRYTLKRNG